MAGSKRILACPYSICAAHVVRPLEICKALRELGHEVLFASGSRYAELIAREGFPLLPIVVEDSATAFARVRRLNFSGAMAAAARHVKEEIDLIEKVRPDMVIGDWRISLSVSTEVTKIPYVSINNAHFTRYSLVDEGIEKNFGNKLAARLFCWQRDMMFQGFAYFYNRVRSTYGLSKKRDLIDLLESSDINLLADIPEFSPTRNLPGHFHYIGPILWEPATSRDHQWLDSFDPQRPTLYLSMGTSGTSRDFWRVLDLLRETPYQVIITTGGQISLSTIRPGFFVTDFAPGSSLVEKSDLVICHGGNGTIYQALSQGKPIIGIPTHFDPEYNMSLVINSGVGLRIARGQLNGQVLTRAIERVRSEVAFGDRAQKLRAALRRYDAPHSGAKIINDFLSRIRSNNSSAGAMS